MDKFNRGKSFEQNSQLQIELFDEYDHMDDSIEYVVENVLQTTNTETASFQQICENFNSIYNIDCSCSGNYQEQCAGENCLHGANYITHTNIKSNQYELILNENRKSMDVIYECSDLCKCSPNCCNRLVQFGPRKHLKIANFSHLHKHLGLITTESIPKGAFVCEYAGEIITKDEANERYRLIDENNQMNYIICLNEYPIESKAKSESEVIQTYVDPKFYGNIGRYLNHSCDPNCEIISVRLDGVIPKLCKKFKLLSQSCQINKIG